MNANAVTQGFAANKFNHTGDGRFTKIGEVHRNLCAAIHQQAASSTIDIAQLQQAFNNLYQTMDAIADFKSKALVSMQTTVNTLTDEVAKSRSYVDRVRRQEAAEASGSDTGVRL